MTDLTPQEKRHQTLLSKYGSEEGVKQFYRDTGAKSLPNRIGKPSGFAKLTKEQRSEMGRKGALKRYGGKKTDQTTA